MARPRARPAPPARAEVPVKARAVSVRRPKDWPLASAVVLLAVLLRIAFAVVFLGQPVSGIVPLDTEPYRALGAVIAAFRFDDPGFDCLNPPYAFLLAPFASLPEGTSRVFVTAVQIALEAATVGLTYFVALRAFSTGVAAGAATIYATYGAAVFYSANVLPVTLSVLTFMAALAALLFAEGRRPAFWLIAGTALGVFVLTRPNAVALLPVVALWARGRTVRHIAFLLAGTALVLAPFSLRSMRAGNGGSPFPLNGGINFYIGNSPFAHGRYAHIPNVTDKPGDQMRTSIAEASRRAGRPLEAREASAFWLHEGVAFIVREPAAAVRLTLRKAAMFFRAEEPPLNVSYDFAREHVGILRAGLGLGAVLPFFFWGVAAAFRDPELRARPSMRLLLGALVAYAASVIVFFVSDRYRLPAVPLLGIFAAYGGAALLSAIRRRAWPRVLLGASVLASGALFASAPFPFLTYARDGVDHVRLSDVYIERGDYDRALAECQEAASWSPRTPDTLFCFATAHYFKKEYFDAEMGLRATIAAQAGTASDLAARRNLAYVLKEQKLFEDALREAEDDAQRDAIRAEYERFKATTRDLAAYARGQYDEGIRHQREGRLTEARYALRRSVQADASRPEVFSLLAAVDHALSLEGEACEAARRAAEARSSESRYQEAVGAYCR
jgi:tetratricopeptide (TPR) repeat protein